MRRGSDPLQLVRELAAMGEFRIDMQHRVSSSPPRARSRALLHHMGSAFCVRRPTSKQSSTSSYSSKTVANCRSNLTRNPRSRIGSDRACPSGEARSVQGAGVTTTRPTTASSIRVAAAKLDQFVNLVGELVTVQARLSELASRRDDPEMTTVAEEVDRLASALRETSMNVRMMPIRGTFEKFRRLVHDFARDLGKECRTRPSRERTQSWTRASSISSATP